MRGFTVVSTMVLIAMFGMFAMVPVMHSGTGQQTGSMGATEMPLVDHGKLRPDWAAIAAWPLGIDATGDEPDPDRDAWALIIDDSKSMGRMIVDAKKALTDALAEMEPSSRVALLAINRGELAEMQSVAELRRRVDDILISVTSDGGSTPLAEIVRDARAALEKEGARQQGYGRYRMLIITDGRADNAQALMEAVEDIVSKTPIEIVTIGIGNIGSGHSLNLPQYTTYRAIDGTEGLSSLLVEITAESEEFVPVTTFMEPVGQ